jgi:hypothetical protein
MSNYTATFQFESALETAAKVYDIAAAIDSQLMWIDEEYFQPFIEWAAPRLQRAALNALVWTVVGTIKLCLWLIDTIDRCGARDAEAIALVAYALANAPVKEQLALPPSVTITFKDGEQSILSQLRQLFEKKTPQSKLLPSFAIVDDVEDYGFPNGTREYVPIVAKITNPQPIDMHREVARMALAGSNHDAIASALDLSGTVAERKPHKATIKSKIDKRRTVLKT